MSSTEALRAMAAPSPVFKRHKGSLGSVPTLASSSLPQFDLAEEQPEPNPHWATDAFLAEIPKTDIHVHLDGSLRLETLVELAGKIGMELPSTDIDKLKADVFKPNFASLEEYLECFRYTTGVMQSRENIERVAYEFAVDNFKEGVRYIEVRFAPQLHCSTEAKDDFDIIGVISSVDAGLSRAREEFNSALLASLKAGEAEEEGKEQGAALPPRYEYAIIVCAMRLFFPGMSRYYDALYALHPHASAKQVTSMASVNLVQAAKVARDHHGIPVVAIDVAGAERDHEASVHADAFTLAHKYKFGKTVHAGEGFGPESIWQAVRDLHAERIGHGFHLFSRDLLQEKENKESSDQYVAELVKYVSDRRITMEVCLTSNLNTMPELTLSKHAFAEMLSHRLSVTLSTDNRLVSNTTPQLELKKAIEAFRLSPKQLKEIVITGFKRSFYPGSYTERRKYVRTCMDFYDRVSEKHNVPTESSPHFSAPYGE